VAPADNSAVGSHAYANVFREHGRVLAAATSVLLLGQDFLEEVCAPSFFWSNPFISKATMFV
jgi:hypothetical protein